MARPTAEFVGRAPSGSRNEEVFEDAYEFRVDRKPNRHLAFGYDAQLCRLTTL